MQFATTTLALLERLAESDNARPVSLRAMRLVNSLRLSTQRSEYDDQADWGWRFSLEAFSPSFSLRNMVLVGECGPPV